MEYANLAILIIIGLFGAGSLIGAGALIASLTPFKAIIGIVALVFGILGALELSFGASIGQIMYLVGVIAEIGLGIIFAAAIVPAMSGVAAKLKAFEVILGIAALVVAVYAILGMVGVLGGGAAPAA